MATSPDPLPRRPQGDHSALPKGRFEWGDCVAILAATLLACWPALDGHFVYDDEYYVLQNEAVRGDASPWTSPLGSPEQGLWRPITVASYRLQWSDELALSDTKDTPAGPYLRFNVAIHALVALLVAAFGRSLGLGRGAAVVAGVLFAVHPIHAESVAWVSGRAELLAAAFVLAAWLAHRSPGARAAWVAPALFATAALSKENALVAPVLFLVGDLLLPARRPPAGGDATRQPSRRVPWMRLATLAGVAAALWFTRGAILGRFLPGDAPYGDLPLAERGLVALNILGRTAILLAWPHPMRIHYHRDEFLLWQPTAVIALLGAAACTWFLWRRQRLLGASLLFVPLALAPVLNLVPIGETFAERFLYFPSVFACLAIATWLAGRFRAEVHGGRGVGGSAALLAAVLVLAVPTSRAAVSVFHQDLSLWAHAAEVAPRNAHARYNHGYFLHAAGRHLDADRDSPGSHSELAASLRLEPQHPDAAFAHQILGVAAMSTNPRAAADHFRQALVALPALVEARINLANVALMDPEAVPPAEALASLRLVLANPDLDAARRALIEELADQLASSPDIPSATGTSSPEGS